MLSFISFIKESLILLENKVKFFSQQAKMPEEHVEKLAKADPNPKRKNLGWLVKQHKDGNIRSDMLDTFHPDDIKSHKDALQRFEDTKKDEPKSAAHIGDLMKVKDVAELHGKIDDWHENHSKANHLAKWGEKVFDEGGHHIYHLSTSNHCENHGNGSSWCTRIKDGTYQEHYRENGNLYVHYPKGSPKPGEKGHDKNSERYQFWVPHEPSEYSPAELKNLRNHSIEPDDHDSEHPVLNKSDHWHQFKEAHENSVDHYEGSEEHIHELVNSDDWQDRVTAVREYGAHHEYDHLYHDEDDDVRKAIIEHNARNGRHDDNVLRFENDSSDIRAHLIKHMGGSHIARMYGNIPEHGEEDHLYGDIADHHAEPNWHGDAHAIASNTNTPRSVHESIIKNEKGFPEDTHARLRRDIAENYGAHRNNGDLDSTLMHKIMDHPNNTLKTYHAVAEHAARKDADQSLVNRLVNHEDPNARHAAAEWHGEKPEVFNALKDDGDPRVQERLAQHHPEHFIHTTNDAVRKTVFNKLPHNHPAKSAMLDKFAQSSNPNDHELVAKHGTAAQISQPNVLHSKSEQVGAWLHHRMQNETDPLHNDMEFHKTLATSANPNTREVTAIHSKSPEALHMLKDDTSSNVASHLLSNPHISNETVVHLANHHPNESVGKKIGRMISHPRSYGEDHIADNHELHAQLAHTNNEHVLGAIAGSSKSQEALRTLASRKKHGWSVVANPHASHEILNHYANHENADLRDFANEEIKKRQQT